MEVQQKITNVSIKFLSTPEKGIKRAKDTKEFGGGLGYCFWVNKKPFAPWINFKGISSKLNYFCYRIAQTETVQSDQVWAPPLPLAMPQVASLIPWVW